MRMLDITRQKQVHSFWGFRVPRLLPAHHCTANVDLCPCHIDKSVDSRAKAYAAENPVQFDMNAYGGCWIRVLGQALADRIPCITQ
jgi:hypothetical protein